MARKKKPSRKAPSRKPTDSKAAASPASKAKKKRLGPGEGKGKTGGGVQLLGEVTRGTDDQQVHRFKMRALANMGLDESALSPHPGVGPYLLGGLLIGMSVWGAFKIAQS